MTPGPCLDTEANRALFIAEIHESGSPKDKEQLERSLSKEHLTGPVPLIVLIRLLSPFARRYTKVYQTPTILKEWKDSMPAPAAVWFFHECDEHAIEEAY
jgi:hypothetical protein